jgi:hypothetical protein
MVIIFLLKNYLVKYPKAIKRVDAAEKITEKVGAFNPVFLNLLGGT